ncbi:hypothetical protein ACWEQ3_46590 [Streptomyces mirabilis]
MIAEEEIFPRSAVCCLPLVKGFKCIWLLYERHEDANQPNVGENPQNHSGDNGGREKWLLVIVVEEMNVSHVLSSP